MLNIKELWELAMAAEDEFSDYDMSVYASGSITHIVAEKFVFALLQKDGFMDLFAEDITFLDTLHYAQGDFFDNSDLNHGCSLSECGYVLGRNDFCSGDRDGLCSIYSFLLKQSGWDYSYSWPADDCEEGKEKDLDSLELANRICPDRFLPKEGDGMYSALSGFNTSYLDNVHFVLFWNEKLYRFLNWEKTYQGRYKTLAGKTAQILYRKIPDLFQGAELLYSTEKDSVQTGDAFFLLYYVDVELNTDQVSPYVLFYMLLVEQLVCGFDRMYHFLDAAKENVPGKEAA